MGFSVVFDSIAKPFIELHEWDSGSERIVHDTTINILLLVGLLLAGNMMFGEDIACLVLPEFPDSFVDYIKDLCFYQDKYRVQTQVLYNKTSEGIFPIHNENVVAVNYYQWIPFLILLKLLLCLLPSVIWKMIGLHYFYGIDFAAIMKGLVDKQGGDRLADDGDADTELEAVRTRRWLELKKQSVLGKCSTMMIYVCTKWLTSLFLYFQFYLMAKIYANGELLWGVHITYDVLNGVYQNSFSGVFPQVVVCKSHRLQVGGDVNEFKFRCILPHNYINSKVFLFMYWWYLFVILVSLYSAVQYTAFLISSAYQKHTLSNLLPSTEFFRLSAKKDKQNLVFGDAEYSRFLDYLGNDGFLLLKCSSVPISPLIWRNFVYKLYMASQANENVANLVEGTEEDRPSAPTGKYERFGNKYKKERYNNKLQTKPLMMYSTASSSSESPPNERYTRAPAEKHSYYPT